MASQDNNPYKRFKGLMKGKKMSGDEVHKMAQKAAKRKAPEPEKQDLGMAMKKKRKGLPTINSGKEGDVEHKRKAGSTVGGKDLEHKRKQAPFMAQTKKLRKASKRKGSTMTVPKGGMTAAGTSQRLPGGKQITNPAWVNAPKSNAQVGLPTPKMGGTSAPLSAMSVSTPMKKRKSVKKK